MAIDAMLAHSDTSRHDKIPGSQHPGLSKRDTHGLKLSLHKKPRHAGLTFGARGCSEAREAIVAPMGLCSKEGQETLAQADSLEQQPLLTVIVRTATKRFEGAELLSRPQCPPVSTQYPLADWILSQVPCTVHCGHRSIYIKRCTLNVVAATRGGAL
eukprot:1156745-Pelagomonas_calceolata.AAC.12